MDGDTCTMYVHAERKNGGRWDRCPDIKFDGDSSIVYGALGNARNHGDLAPLAAWRGLPTDASSEVYEFYRSDAHLRANGWTGMVSWVGLPELLSTSWDLLEQLYHESPNFGILVEQLRELAAGAPGDVRLIFWFDDSEPVGQPAPNPR
jgi:hypothetical protein